jgi:hypothetical protein
LQFAICDLGENAPSARSENVGQTPQAFFSIKLMRLLADVIANYGSSVMPGLGGSGFGV